MLRDKSFFLLFFGLICCSTFAWAQISTAPEPFDSAVSAKSPSQTHALFSPSVAQTFYEIAYDLANSEDITGPKADQTIVFLLAAKQLGGEADNIDPLLIKLACVQSQRDNSEQVLAWLVDYTSESADLEVLTGAAQYLFNKLDSREQREELLEQLLQEVAGKNSIFDSQLATLVGLLKIEKADLEAAKFYLIQAYRHNKYNKLAFAKLAELVPDQVGPVMFLEYLRLSVRQNPLDIETALAFAQYAERLGLFEVAAGAYEYCADLFAYLYPAKALPAQIYIPWMISYYNTENHQHKCLQIARLVRGEDRFDILLEALAGLAAEKIGNTEEAHNIFRSAEEKAWRLLEKGPVGGNTEAEGDSVGAGTQVGAKQFAWFYCFAARDSAKALDWANKAYSTEPNSPVTAGLLAYALMMNEQLEWAKPLLVGDKRTQIGDLVRAQIQLADGQEELAVETLQVVIIRDPGSLAAERAKEMLTELGREYNPPVNPEVILTALAGRLGQSLVPKFISPNKAISVQFNIRGNRFSYGSKFEGTVAIVNKSSEPLVVSNEGLFKGDIRVDASVSGDINRKIPNLVTRKVRSSLLIAPGRGMLISLPLATGELRELLDTYPQASLNIEFTLYLDPATNEQGTVTNRLVDIKPATVTIERPGVDLTAKYLRNRFNSISTGQTGQKVKTAQLFVGLLKEQHAMAQHGTIYRFKYADWMPSLLKSALLHESGLLLNPAEGEWVVKVQTLAEMLSLPLDHELTGAVAENLNNANWPVRLMVIYLLSKNPGADFNRVLDWVVKYDSTPLVRDMAVALGATEANIQGQ